MKVRGWLMIGGESAVANLPPAASVGMLLGPLPHAAEYEPGQWALWRPDPAHPLVCVVCVEIPLT
jgi:hypothetical protein